MSAKPQWRQGRAHPIGFDGPSIGFNRAGFVPIGRHGRLDAATRACIFAAAGMRRIATARAGKPEPGRRARFALVAQ